MGISAVHARLQIRTKTVKQMDKKIKHKAQTLMLSKVLNNQKIILKHEHVHVHDRERERERRQSSPVIHNLVSTSSQLYHGVYLLIIHTRPKWNLPEPRISHIFGKRT